MPSPTVRLRAALLIAALSGFIALSYEIVWYRVLSVMTEGTAATFGLLLAAYLFGVALGSRGSARFCRGPGGDRRQLRVLAIFVAAANVVAALVVPTFAWSATFTDFRLGLAVVAAGAALLGAVLPLVSHFAIEPDDRAGARISYVYLANIVGSSSGSLVLGFVLMDRLSLVGISVVLVVSGFALAALLVVMSAPGKSAAVSYVVLGVLALLASRALPALEERVYERLIYKAEYDGSQRFAQIIENKSGVITVTEDGSVYGGGGYDGVLNVSLQDNERNRVVRAYLVAGLHPAPRDVLMVGLGSGSWAHVVANLPGVERMTILEINPGYVDVVRAHAEVAGLLSNPRAKIVVDDGRRWLLRNPGARFDVIVMNTTMHWRAHATNLLSTEFLEIARAHLKQAGVLYFNTTDSLDAQGTAARTFPFLLRVANFVAVSDTLFHFDRPRWRWVLETMRIDGRPVLDLGREDDRRLYAELCAYNDLEPHGSIFERTKPNTVITDDNMFVEWREPLRYPDLRP